MFTFGFKIEIFNFSLVGGIYTEKPKDVECVDIHLTTSHFNDLKYFKSRKTDLAGVATCCAAMRRG